MTKFHSHESADLQVEIPENETVNDPIEIFESSNPMKSHYSHEINDIQDENHETEYVPNEYSEYNDRHCQLSPKYGEFEEGPSEFLSEFVVSDEDFQPEYSEDIHNQYQSNDSNKFKTSDGEIYWVPDVSDEIRPKKWDTYPSYEDVKAMYFYYAVEAGFDVRKTSQKSFNGLITMQYFVCNREGEPNTSDVNTLDSKHSKIDRRSDMLRRGCEAHIKCRILPGTIKFQIYEVVEKHNHKLYNKYSSHLSKTARKLDALQQSFILRMSSQNIGPTKAHRLYRALHGGYNYKGGNKDDFKNLMRDLNCYIGGSDAQLVVDKLNDRKKHVCNFSFDYKVDNKRLSCLFWADDTSKIHYKEFGDVVSFDATFRTNRYDMVFVPFTGIDNHKRCVTFGAGLLSREDTDSYVWLLESFLKAFCKQPILVLSDQDAAMKKAIAQVFPESRHRLCMWHITSKLQVKVCWELYNNKEFKKMFNGLVWNSKINEVEFEEGWKSFVDQYNLHDNKWFKDMYCIRQHWIPAFFKHIPMSGLMRTTSMSESENSSFQISTNRGTTLVNFMNAFEGTMEKQRHVQSDLDFKDNEKSRKIQTMLEIEKNAANYYTRQIFLQVQNEIKHSLISCYQTSKVVDDVFDVCVISEVKSNPTSNLIKSKKNDDDDKSLEWDCNLNDKEFQVRYNRKDVTFTCTCMNFEHVGILCRHIFCVMKYYRITDIPQKYVLRRWRKDLIPIEILRRTFRYGDMDTDVDLMAMDVFSSVDHCVTSLRSDKEKLAEFVKRVKELESLYLGDLNVVKSSSKHDVFDQFIGVPMPTVIEVENPTGIRNKGCGGTQKRLRSGKELAIEKTAKVPRRCALCGKPAFHDKRNCPLKNKDPSAWSSRMKKRD